MKKNSEFLTITPDMKESVNYISLVETSDHYIGKKMFPNSLGIFDTIIGNVISIQRFMQYVSIDRFPSKYLLQKNLTRKDVAFISGLNTLDLPNYWAIMCYAVCCKVQSNKKLIKALYDNKLPLTIALNRKDEMLGEEMLVNFTKQGNYLAIVRSIEELIKANEFVPAKIKALIDFYKNDKDLDLWAGTKNLVAR